MACSVLLPIGLVTSRMRIRGSKAVDWRLVVRDADGRQAAAWSGSGNAATVTWDGTSGGAGVPDGAYTAAGSVIDSDVPPGALAVGRARQRNVEGWVARRRAGTPAAEAAAAAHRTSGAASADRDSATPEEQQQ